MKCKSMYGLVVLLCLLFIGCDQIDDGNYVEPITVYEKVNGNWTLMNLKMVDEFAKKNAIEPSEQNLSTLFNYPDFVINFSVDDKNQPTTYEVTGNVPPLFAPRGYWKLNSSFQQTDATANIIYLYSDAQKTNKTDELKVTSVPGNNDQMEIQLIRSSEGTAFVSYIFKLKAVN
ncbi:DUF5004 domain-containing protein [Flavobacterium adhaerens]|uniref:DUF5004 domain-containing protein n=1 Tax=Flavobacterium adhaerens TaxID=3149043 RepID=UPI0032B3F38E